MEKVTFVDKNGQITLPPHIREAFNLEAGSPVKVSVHKKTIVVEPTSINNQDSNEYLDLLKELAKKNDTTVGKLVSEFKRLRQKNVKKAYSKLWSRWTHKLNA